MTTRDRSEVHRNSFGLLRMLAALAVVIDHACLLTGHREPVVARWTHATLDLGGLGVMVFFVLSGYLVTASWLRTPDLVTFVRRRVLRIWPALIFLVLATTFVVGPLATDRGLAEYLRDPETWTYLRTVTLAPVEFHLPGVYIGNPQSGMVNGSLWTLPYEVLAYCLLALLGRAGVLHRPGLVAALCLVLAGTSALVVLPGVGNLLGLLTAFFCGAALQVLNVPMRRVGAAGAASLLCVSLACGAYALAVLALPYLIVYAGSRDWRPAVAFSRWGDPSYGVYIYAYPLQQALVGAGVGSVRSLVAASAPAVVALGYLSWHGLERPALSRADSSHPSRRSQPLWRPPATVPSTSRTS